MELLKNIIALSVFLIAGFMQTASAQSGGGFPSRPKFQEVTVRTGGFEDPTIKIDHPIAAPFEIRAGLAGDFAIEACTSAFTCTPFFATSARPTDQTIGVVNFTVPQFQINSQPYNKLRAIKGADTTRASTTTFTADPDLSVTLPVGNWSVKILLHYCSAVSDVGGFKYRAVLGGTDSRATGRVWSIENHFGGGVASTINSTPLSNSFQSDHAAHGICGTANSSTSIVQFELMVNSSGTLTVQWAQVVSDANTATLMAGSHMTAEQL